MKKIERCQQRQAGALDVESAVRVQQPLAALPGYDRAKTEIALRFLGEVIGRVVESLFGHCMRRLYPPQKINVKVGWFFRVFDAEIPLWPKRK